VRATLAAVIRMPADDPLGALKIGPALLAEGASDGTLAGTAFVAKDLYDVAGYPTGAGNPQWEATHPVPATTSSAVTRLLAAGASLIGKSHTDELAYSLSGTNVHYGTPVNSAAPGCVPGGSSSGSASAVAGGLCDFALGSDTGGSVRVPASFCGIFGLRPTHGRVPADGVVPLAPSFDAVGWFANSGAALMQVGRVLLDTDFDETAHLAATKLVLADDLLACVADEVATVVEAAARATAARLDLPLERGSLADGDIASWADCFRTLQRGEAWACHGAWITATTPSFGPGIAQRFADASRVTSDEVAAAQRRRLETRDLVARRTAGGVVFALPAAQGPAYRVDLEGPAKEAVRAGALALTSAAGLAGTPQVTVHGGAVDAKPVGLGLLAGHGMDEALLAMAAALD
jgi:amidase